MALIEQQDVIWLSVDTLDKVPEKVKEHLERYPDVRIVSLQVIPFGTLTNIVLVVETV